MFTKLLSLKNNISKLLETLSNYIILKKRNDDDVLKIMSTFTRQEVRFSGPRDFYEHAQYRIIMYDGKTPIGYLEAMINPDRTRAKINLGVRNGYRGIGISTKLNKHSIQDLTDMGLEVLLYAIDKDNEPSLKSIMKIKNVIEITDNKSDCELYRFYDKSNRYFKVLLK